MFEFREVHRRVYVRHVKPRHTDHDGDQMGVNRRNTPVSRVTTPSIHNVRGLDETCRNQSVQSGAKYPRRGYADRDESHRDKSSKPGEVREDTCR